MIMRILFPLFTFILCATANADPLSQSSVLIELQEEISKHFISVKEEFTKRWEVFKCDKEFIPFAAGKPKNKLEEEFENIRQTRKLIWLKPEFECSRNLIGAGLVRAPKCVAFTYNNTVPYYNASTICLGNQFCIACEGPRLKDISSFFNMLAARKVSHIIRLTDSYEGELNKCHPYWEGLSINSEGSFSIPTEYGEYSVHAYDLAHWKDQHGIDPNELLDLVLRVREETENVNGLPLVHCSAGVGRTGTFLAALAIVEAIDKNASFSIEEITYRLSLQRVYSVANAPQYITLHRLAEKYLERISTQKEV